MYNREVLPNPGQLVTNGKFNFGIYTEPFQVINPLDAKSPMGIPLPATLQNLRLKEWQAIQIGTDRFFMIAAIFNAKVMSLVQLKIYDKKLKKKYLYERRVSPWSIQVANSLWDTTSSFHDNDFRILMHNDIGADRIRLEIDIKNFQDLPNIKGSFEGWHDLNQVTPLVVCMPFDTNQGMYSHKCPMPMQGEFQIDEETIVCETRRAFMLIDDHKGYYPYTMQWDWVTGAGWDNQGRFIGFNFTDNQVIQKMRYNENAVWINGKLNLLPPIKMARVDGVDGMWHIRDGFDRVDIKFYPEVPGAVDINYLIAESRYRGPFGRFEGTIRTLDGDHIFLDQFFGMGEKFYLRV